MSELLKNYREAKSAWESARDEAQAAREVWRAKMSAEYDSNAAYWKAVEAINAADLAGQ
jgi:hypothetical protein